MKIGIYNPYLDGLAGGERYTSTLAAHWSKKHDVFLFWDDPSILEKAQERFSLDLTRVALAHNVFRGKNFLNKIINTKSYDCIFFLSDGSMPLSLAKYNIIHFQIPFQNLNLSALKFKRYQAVVCNSKFTKDNIDPIVSSRAMIIYPPVISAADTRYSKKNIILSVGRFSGFFQTKKQEILIDAFSKSKSTGILTGWRLVFAGGLLNSDKEYFENLRKKAMGLPIDFYPNISYKDLIELYNSAKLYWHAAGFDETNPQNMEHFGISTVEAMSAGCIPISYNGGGQKEIIKHGINGFLWLTLNELLDYSQRLAKNKQIFTGIARHVKKSAERFNVDRFNKDFDLLLETIITK